MPIKNPDVPLARFGHLELASQSEYRGLRADHPASRLGRSIFPKSIVNAADAPRVLVSGINQRKLGDRVTKGKWRGMPIYALTLEERATCPWSCANWLLCYGNSMPYSRRHAAGGDLLAALQLELRTLQCSYPGGFLVRLHVLGDFYSADYVSCWSRWLDEFPALHIFGYSAWPIDSEIGKAVHGLAGRRWDRFAIRQSHTEPGPRRAITVTQNGDHQSVVVCPAQTGKTATCGSCGLCWAAAAQDKTIAFIQHGMRRSPKAGRPRKDKGLNGTAG